MDCSLHSLSLLRRMPAINSTNQLSKLEYLGQMGIMWHAAEWRRAGWMKLSPAPGFGVALAMLRSAIASGNSGTACFLWR